ncbi:MAG: hypothetical protein RID09_29575 [Coleofasciculus sp. G1-WW12-02]|uniref:hypothetical protein n=1 Tax=unclassified Coleofasciculus TaxID=2692782 RepID=UPI003303C400
MQSKTIQLFLALTVAATLGACDASNLGTEDGEAEEGAPQTEQMQEDDDLNAEEGGEEGEEDQEEEEEDENAEED